MSIEAVRKIVGGFIGREVDDAEVVMRRLEDAVSNVTGVVWVDVLDIVDGLGVRVELSDGSHHIVEVIAGKAVAVEAAP